MAETESETIRPEFRSIFTDCTSCDEKHVYRSHGQCNSCGSDELCIKCWDVFFRPPQVEYSNKCKKCVMTLPPVQCKCCKGFKSILKMTFDTGIVPDPNPICRLCIESDIHDCSKCGAPNCSFIQWLPRSIPLCDTCAATHGYDIMRVQIHDSDSE